MDAVSEQIAALLGDRSASTQLKPEGTDLKGEVDESSFALASDRLFKETVQNMVFWLMIYLSYEYLKVRKLLMEVSAGGCLRRGGVLQGDRL